MNTGGRWESPMLHLGGAFSTLVCALLLGSGVRAADDAGWYTQEQATHGHQLFNNFCAQCHGPDLTGAAGPALVGNAFLQKWGKKSVGDLVTFEHTTMPVINPGSLPEDTVWAVTAYILQKNDFPAGTVALSQQTGTNRTLEK